MPPSPAALRVAVVAATIASVGATTVLVRGQARPVPLALVDRNGHKTPLGSLPALTFALRVAPDGRRITYDTGDGSIWIAELSHLTSARRLTSVRDERFPMWMAEGEQIAFTSERDGVQTLYSQRADGTGLAERIAPARAPESWSRSNRMLSFITFGGDYGIWTYSLKEKRATPLIDLPGSDQHSSQFSPDGKWIAYASNESRQWEVYVQPFPLTGWKIQVTTSGGGHPVWSPDGKELFIDRDRHMFLVRVRTEPTFTVGTPVPLPISGFIQGAARRQYDLMPDGRQFLMLFP
jgi:Tol biopolymer transport system component